MSKLHEAQSILAAIGMPPAQQNEMAALVLLVLAHVREDSAWTAAQAGALRIHDLLVSIREWYGRDYAENTRETVRRQVIHQFEQAGLVVRNPNAPDLPTNSPRTHYALSAAMVALLHAYQTPAWEATLTVFLQEQGALVERYQRQRRQHRIPLTYRGQTYHLSAGRHNQLQVAIIEEYGPRFAAGAAVIYVGDSENKRLIIDENTLTALGLALPSHDKLPDVILYDAEQERLFLIEAVTSHGPVSPKRRLEFVNMVGGTGLDCVYVSAFPDFATLKQFLTDIAWGTDVWLSDHPDHLIHFNGDPSIQLDE